MPSVAAGSLPLFRLGTAAQQEAAWGPVTGPALPQPQPPGAATRPVGQGLIRGWQQQGPDVSSTRPTTQSFLPLPSPPAWALPTRAALPGRTLGSTGHWVHRDPRQQEPRSRLTHAGGRCTRLPGALGAGGAVMLRAWLPAPESPEAYKMSPRLRQSPSAAAPGRGSSQDGGGGEAPGQCHIPDRAHPLTAPAQPLSPLRPTYGAYAFHSLVYELPNQFPFH